MMNNAIMGMFAETFLHPGSGQTANAIDLPVAREKTTNYPVIPGSSLKGALRDFAELLSADADHLFGRPESAGVIAVTDGRLLLLPVRSLNTHFVWITCPYLIERYWRDYKLSAISETLPELPSIELKEGQAAADSSSFEYLYLEELSFEIVPTDLSVLVNNISPLIKHDSVRTRLKNSLVVINDDEFNYFASNCLAVNARNRLEKDTKTSENLWYEETIPAETLFYTLLIARPIEHQNNAIKTIAELFEKRPYLQVGGNETVGQGWCAISLLIGGEM